MKISIQDINAKTFESLPRPKISISGDMLEISDPPFAWRIFLAFFCTFLIFIASRDKEIASRTTGMLLGWGLFFVFVYDSLSLQRVKIDFINKTVYRTSLNPLENLINRILGRPSKLPFSNIEKVYSDYREAFGGASQRYYLYIRSGDPYSLKIGTFNTESDAKNIASILNKLIK
ncbi:MAG TPA: hypothetical protein VGM30_10825 [Puia sp.]|jgi:hypothetical protein